jgi:hypothetical protein
MDSVQKLTKTIKNGLGKLNSEQGVLSFAYIVFALSAVWIFYNGQLLTIGLAIGVAMLLKVATRNLAAALIAGALAGLVAVHCSRRSEAFENPIPMPGVTSTDEEPFEDAAAKVKGEDESNEQDGESQGKAPTAAEAKKPKKVDGFKGGRNKVPNNGTRGEFFELGKKYKGPSEDDDSEFHLDAGTTFMNAYKSLKPDQIAAMTKDTQELMQTQKELMGTLATLKPLIQDGKQMMDMFQGYFGSGPNAMN